MRAHFAALCLVLVSFALLGCLQSSQSNPGGTAAPVVRKGTPTPHPTFAPTIGVQPIASASVSVLPPTPALSPSWVNFTANYSPGEDSASAIAFDPAGFLYVAGTETVGDTSDTQWRVEKLNTSDGKPIWSYTSKPSPNNRAAAIALDPAGYLYVAGTQLVAGSDSEWRVEKLGAFDGSLKWTYTSNPSAFFDGLNAIVLDPSAGYLYVGGAQALRPSTSSPFSPGSIWRAERISVQDGKMNWNYTENFGESNTFVRSVAVDNDGFLYLAGSDRASGSGGWRLEKVNVSNSSTVWNFTGSDNDTKLLYSMVRDVDGGIYLAGSKAISGSPFSEWFVDKVNSNGSFLWNYTHDPTPLDDIPLALAADANSLYVVGYANDDQTAGSDSYWYAERLTASNGERTWNYTSDPGKRRKDQANAVALDVGANYLYIAGFQGVKAKDTQWRVEQVPLTG